MNIKSIVGIGVGSGLMTIGLAMGVVKALSRGEIHQIQDSERFPIIEQVDEFVLSDFNSPNIEDLECFKIDTLEIKEDMFVSPQQLSEYLQDKSAAKIRKVTTDIKTTPVMGDGSGVGIKTTHTRTPLYLPGAVQAIMQNKVYANEKEDKFYVPVEYYSKKNPFVPPKFFRKN